MSRQVGDSNMEDVTHVLRFGNQPNNERPVERAQPVNKRPHKKTARIATHPGTIRRLEQLFETDEEETDEETEATEETDSTEEAEGGEEVSSRPVKIKDEPGVPAPAPTAALLPLEDHELQAAAGPIVYDEDAIAAAQKAKKRQKMSLSQLMKELDEKEDEIQQLKWG